MATADLYVAFGADTGGLEAALAVAKAQVTAMTRELNAMGSKMVKAGGDANAALVERMKAAGSSLDAAKSRVSDLKTELGGLGGALGDVGAHAAAAGPGMAFMSRELRALADEASSGRWRNFDGTLIGIIGHSTGLISSFVQANPALTAFAAATAIAAGALAYFEVKAVEAKNAKDRLTASANLSGGLVLPKDQIDSYMALLERSKGATQALAESAIDAFQNMSDASASSVSAMVADFGLLVSAGVPPEEAIKKLTAAFGESLTSIDKVRELIKNLTADQQAQIEMAQKSGNAVQVQAAVQKAFAENARKNADQQIADLRKLIATKEQLIEIDQREIAAGIGNEAELAAVRDLIAGWQDQIDLIKKAADAVTDYGEKIKSTQQPVDDVIKRGLEAGESVGNNKAVDELRTKILDIEKAINAGGGGSAAQWPPAGVDWGKASVFGAQTGPNDGLSASLKEAMERLSAQFGAYTVTSTTQGGHAPDSQHYLGNAIDVSTRGFDEAKYAQAISDAIKAGFTGIGISGTHLHLDTRPSTTGAQVFPDVAGDQSPVFGKSPAEWAAQFGGGQASAAPAVAPQSADTMQKLNQELTEARSKLFEITAAQRGLTESQKADLQIARESASARQNEVKIAEQRAAAAQIDLRTAQQAGASEKDLYEPATRVAAAERAVTEAKEAQVEASLKLAVSQAKASHDVAAIRAAETSLNQFLLSAAGQSAEKINAAKEAQIATDGAYNDHVREETMKTRDQEIAAAEETARARVDALKGQLDDKTITESKWLEETVAALNGESAVVKAAYDAEIAVAGQTSEQIIAIKTREQKALADIADQVVKTQRSASTESEKAWKSYADTAASAVNGQVNGLLRGTTSVSQAIKNMAATGIEDVIKFCVKWAFEHAATVAANIASLGAQTTATAASTATQTATIGAGVAAQKAINATSVQGDAGRAAAGAYASVAGIPIIGPILAPAAAAVAFGAVEAFGSFDVGSWQLPSDMMAQVHAGEMIVPAAATPWAQSLMANAASGGGGGAGGGGGGGDHYHFHGALMDAASVTRVVQKHLAGNPSARPRER